MLHWRVEPEAVRRRIPEPLELDTLDGAAWLTLVAQRTQRTRLGPVPVGGQDYAQVNLRTYVRHDGIPGIWLLAVAASDPLACVGARLLGLPYTHAPMEVRAGRARVLGERPLSAAWLAGASAAPTGGAHLDRFLLDRSSLYSRVGGLLLRTDARHPPWRPQRMAGRMERWGRLPQTLQGRQPDLAHNAGTVAARLARPWRVGEPHVHRTPAPKLSTLS